MTVKEFSDKTSELIKKLDKSKPYFNSYQVIGKQQNALGRKTPS